MVPSYCQMEKEVQVLYIVFTDIEVARVSRWWGGGGLLHPSKDEVLAPCLVFCDYTSAEFLRHFIIGWLEWKTYLPTWRLLACV